MATGRSKFEVKDDVFGSSGGMDSPGNPQMARYPPLTCPTADPRLARDTYVGSWFEKCLT